MPFPLPCLPLVHCNFQGRRILAVLAELGLGVGRGRTGLLLRGPRVSFPATRLARMALRNLGSALQAAGSRGRSGKGRQSGNKRRRQDKEKKTCQRECWPTGPVGHRSGPKAKRFSFGFVPDPREVGRSQRGPPPPEGDFRLREAGPVCAPRRLFSGHLVHLILTRTLEVGAVIVLAFRVQRLSWPNKQLLRSHPERMQLTRDLTPSPDVTAGARTNVRGSLDHVLREHGDGSDLSPQDSPATGGRSKRHVRERDPEDPGQPFAVWLPRNRSTSLSIPFFI